MQLIETCLKGISYQCLPSFMSNMISYFQHMGGGLQIFIFAMTMTMSLDLSKSLLDHTHCATLNNFKQRRNLTWTLSLHGQSDLMLILLIDVLKVYKDLTKRLTCVSLTTKLNCFWEGDSHVVVIIPPTYLTAMVESCCMALSPDIFLEIIRSISTREAVQYATFQALYAGLV